jgi:hypothetical protein
VLLAPVPIQAFATPAILMWQKNTSRGPHVSQPALKASTMTTWYARLAQLNAKLAAMPKPALHAKQTLPASSST